MQGFLFCLEQSKEFSTESVIFRKMATKSVPYMLTNEQKCQHVNTACDLLSHLKPEEPKCVKDVITADETWVPSYSVASKSRNKAWLGPNGQRHQIYRPELQNRSHWKLMFCLLTSPSQGHFMHTKKFANSHPGDQQPVSNHYHPEHPPSVTTLNILPL